MATFFRKCIALACIGFLSTPYGFSHAQEIPEDADPIGKIEGIKYNDLNENSVFDDESEDPIEGWSIRLYDRSWSPVDSTSTNIDGEYSFEGLPFGGYFVCEHLPESWSQTAPTSGIVFSLLASADNGSPLLAEEGPLCWETELAPEAPDSYGLDFGNVEGEESEPEEPEYDTANYCGDGVVNQRWEQCDGEEGCSDQCQYTDSYLCNDLVLAQVVTSRALNNDTGNGDMTSDVFVGQGSSSIPDGTWFPLYWNGSYFTDSDVSGYEDVPGYAIERQEGSVRLVMHGGGTSDDDEFAEGYVNFWGVTPTAQREDPENVLENPFNGTHEEPFGSGDDELELDGNLSRFILKVSSGDDGFFTDYGEVPVCEECSVEGYKYDKEGNTLPGWTIGLGIEEDADEGRTTGRTITTSVTDEGGYYCLDDVLRGEEDYRVFEELQEGWEAARVDVADDEDVEWSSDSFFDVFVEVDLSGTGSVAVDFYNAEEEKFSCDFVYGSNDRKDLNQVDPNTGIVTPIAELAFGSWAVAVDGDAQLAYYLSTNGSQLGTYDFATDSNTSVSVTGDTIGNTSRLSFNSFDGFLYSGDQNDHLFRVTTAGVSTDLGEISGVTAGGGDISFAPDGTLYLIGHDAIIYEVDYSGAPVATALGDTGLDRPSGLAYKDGGLYISNMSSSDNKVEIYFADLSDVTSPVSVGPVNDVRNQDLASCVTVRDPEEPEYAPYCGDGVVNQEWEQCDGNGPDRRMGGPRPRCNDQCQLTRPNQCSDLLLARVVTDNVENKRNGNMTSDVYVGQGDNPIPGGTWFALHWNGNSYVDPGVGSYEDVPGYAVQRKEGTVRLVMHTNLKKKDREHVDGSLEFWNTSPTKIRKDNKNSLEKGSNGTRGGTGNDEAEIDGDSVLFWMTANTGDDGFWTDYAEPEECVRCLVEGYKYDEEGNALSGWTIGLGGYIHSGGGDERSVEMGIMTTDVTDEDGYYCLEGSREIRRGSDHRVFEELQEGWEAARVDVADDEDVEWSSDSFFDVFVEVELPRRGRTLQVDFYNLYEEEPEYAAYCGDGSVNQRWEQCDSEEGCTDQCQYVETQQCTDLVLAQVVSERVLNNEGGNGNMTSDVYVGQDSSPIPDGTWFPVYWNGSYFVDPDVSGYEDVPGYAVERQNGSVRLVMHGGETGADDEFAQGYISFWNATATGQREDPENVLENPFNGTHAEPFGNGNDELELDGGISRFILKVSTGDDGFFTDYSEPPVCDDYFASIFSNNSSDVTLAEPGDKVNLNVFLFEEYNEEDVTISGTINGEPIDPEDVVHNEGGFFIPYMPMCDDTSGNITFDVTFEIAGHEYITGLNPALALAVTSGSTTIRVTGTTDGSFVTFDDDSCSTYNTGGSGGGGGGGGNTGGSPDGGTDPEEEEEEEVASDSGREVASDSGQECTEYIEQPHYRFCPMHGGDIIFGSYLESIQCEGFAGPDASMANSRYSSRLGVLSMAVKMLRTEPTIWTTDIPFPFRDIGSPDARSLAVTAIAHDVLEIESEYFRPEQQATRIEVYDFFSRAVCMHYADKTDPNWKRDLYTVAGENRLTIRSWENFDPDDIVLPQEVFVIASRAADWAERTGGCNEAAVLCLEDLETKPEEEEDGSSDDES